MNILDFDAAAVESQNKLAQWEAEFQRKFHQPLLEMAKMQSLAQMTPEEVQMFRQQAPETIDKMINRLRQAGGQNGKL